jgi:NADH dehydrogenase
VASDPTIRRRLLTIVVIGGGLVGVELLGELTAFADDVLRYYPRIARDELRFHLIEATPTILPEVSAGLAAVARRELSRRGADIRVATPVRRIEATRVHLDDETIDAATIVLAAGIEPSPAVARIPVMHDERGRIAVDEMMRSKSHPNVWALGDCAAIPGPDGRPYPALAQHAVREGPRLARNVAAVIAGRAPEPFRFRSLGTMVALGHTRAVSQVGPMQLTGFFAWWFRRTYYLFQMPRWDRRLRIVLDWTVALFFKPDITKVDLAVEHHLPTARSSS